jgi:hypothetical protein
VHTIPHRTLICHGKAKAPRKRKAEYAPHRPVLSVRVKEEMFESICAAPRRLTSASRRKYIAAWMGTLYAGTSRKPRSRKRCCNKEEIIVEVLESRGYTRISILVVQWAEPGVRMPPSQLARRSIMALKPPSPPRSMRRRQGAERSKE